MSDFSAEGEEDYIPTDDLDGEDSTATDHRFSKRFRTKVQSSFGSKTKIVYEDDDDDQNPSDMDSISGDPTLLNDCTIREY